MAPRTAPTEFDESPDPDLLHQLEQSRDRGFLGPGPVVDHVHHARAFARVLGPAFVGRVVDLGSGGGVPGLILARMLPDAEWLLADANLRRVQFLRNAVRQLKLGGSVEARHVRAEELGREDDWRSQVDAVVARSFGPPAVVAECASPLLRSGGQLIVSEPPKDEVRVERWPAAGLDALGLKQVPGPSVGGHRVAVFRQASPAPEGFPRRAGVPARKPLF